jgi:hypothetical protein
MEDRNAKLNLVKEILRSPLFQSKTLDEQQAVLDQIIATGEISRYEILELIQQEVQQPIINNSNLKPEEVNYLENLPYDIFLNIIYTGKLEGEDLIRLCNTSSVINEKCNRSFSLQGSNRRGTVIAEIETIPQYMFYQLLKRMGVEPSIEKFNQGEDYRQQYLKASRHKAFYFLHQKFKTLEQITRRNGIEGENIIVEPGNLFDLFYGEEQYQIGLLVSVISNSRRIPEIVKYNFDKILETIRTLYDFRSIIINEGLLGATDSEGWFKALKVRLDFQTLANLFGISLDQFLNEYYVPYVTQGLERMLINPNINLTFNHVQNLDKIFAEMLRNIFTTLALSYDDIKREIRKSWNLLISTIIEAYSNDLQDLDNIIQNNQNFLGQDQQAVIESYRRDLQTLELLKDFTDQELDYLIYLHKKILTGQLSILTPFTYEDLRDY